MNSKSYNKILHESRQKEINLNKQALRSIISLLTAISSDIDAMILRFAGDYGKLRKEQLSDMKNRISEDLDVFKEQYEDILNYGVSGTTELIIGRNGEIFIQAEGTRKLIDYLHDEIIRAVAFYKEKDGLILSDRIWRISEQAKMDITNRLQQGILLGESHTKVAKDIRHYIKTSGGLRYKSERLVLTEMAKAYKMTNEMSVENMRQNSKFMWFEKWELSPAHPKPDVCDILATQDLEGEGPGIYKKAPNRHPGCLCYIYPVYREKRTRGKYPSVSTMTPQTEDLPNSQIKLAKELNN